MRPLKEIPQEVLRGIEVVLSDIDDTLTEAGRLPSTSIAALEQLQAAGVKVVPVTGRPAGWCDMIARMWPVNAVVGENGALYFAYDHAKRKMSSCYAKSEAQRVADRLRLDALAREVLRQVPEAGMASDQAYRVADIAIDFCEDVAPLKADRVDKIIQILVNAGATCKISSIHVNAWYGNYDKLSMTGRCLKDLLGIELSKSLKTIVFAGDSPNDAPMFGYFPHSVGVANVRNFQLKHEPAWVTSRESAQGFLELADAIVSAKHRQNHEAEHRMER